MTPPSDKGGGLSPLSEAAAWAREHRAAGSPVHNCDPVATKDSAGFVVAEFCGVCGRTMSYRPNGWPGAPDEKEQSK